MQLSHRSNRSDFVEENNLNSKRNNKINLIKEYEIPKLINKISGEKFLGLSLKKSSNDNFSENKGDINSNNSQLDSRKRSKEIKDSTFKIETENLEDENNNEKVEISVTNKKNKKQELLKDLYHGLANTYYNMNNKSKNAKKAKSGYNDEEGIAEESNTKLFKEKSSSEKMISTPKYLNERNEDGYESNINDLAKVVDINMNINKDSLFRTISGNKPEKNNIFWTKNEIKDFQTKVRTACKNIIEKQKEFFSVLYSEVYRRNKDEILRILKNEQDCNFHKLELKKPKLLEEILICQMPDIVEILIQYRPDIFKFDDCFIMSYTEKMYRKIEGYLSTEDEKSKNYLNLIKLKFYKHEHIKIIIWFISHFGYLEPFILLRDKHLDIFSADSLVMKVDDFESMSTYCSNIESIRLVIKECLHNNFEELANLLLMKFSLYKDEEIIETALNKESLNFLRNIWESFNRQAINIDQSNLEQNAIEEDEFGSTSFKLDKSSEFSKTSISFKSNSLYKSTNTEMKDIINLRQEDVPFTISQIIPKLKDVKKSNDSKLIYDIINTWKYLKEDKNLVNILFEHKLYDEILNLIWKQKTFTWELSESHFRQIINDKQLELMIHFLKFERFRNVLKNKNIQETIVNVYFSQGYTLYYGSIAISFIKFVNWNNNLTKDLCRNIFNLIKSKNIMDCHSPILTSLLICESLKQISEISVEQSNRCIKVIEELMKFICNIQEANQNENYIKYLMEQKDINGRNSFQIASENNFFEVLENPEIGTIVKKLWNGDFNISQFTSISSVEKFCFSNNESSNSSNDTFKLLEPIDFKKNQRFYSHQLHVWKFSCSTRTTLDDLMTILLILVYNLFIYYLVNEKFSTECLMISNRNYDFCFMEKLGNISTIYHNGNGTVGLTLDTFTNTTIPFNIDKSYLETSLMVDVENLQGNTNMLYYIFTIMALCLNLSNINYFLYSKLISREYKLDYMVILEFILFIFSLSLFLHPDRFGYEIVLLDDEKYSVMFATLMRVTLLALCDIIVWLRITNILLTWRNIGPLIHIIYMIVKIMLNYIFVLALYITSFASVFIVIFYKRSDNFSTFSQAIYTLFLCFLSEYQHMDLFTKDWKIIGAFAMTFFVTLSGILIINMLIAFISNFYKKIIKVVDSTHRAILIKYYRKNKLGKSYGWMMFLAPPFNIINFIIFPFFYFFSYKQSNSPNFNENTIKIFHSVFIMPFLILLFIFYNIILMPFCYLRGIGNHIFLLINNSNFIVSFLLLFKWILGGIPFLFYIVARDTIHMVKHTFDVYESKITEIERIKKFIKEENVVLFLNFIHKRDKNQSNELHNIFLDYLTYENEFKTENDNDLKERSKYIAKIQSANSYHRSKSKKKLTSRGSKSNTTLLFTTMKKNNDKDSNMITNSYTKKNLIIIEILENFLIQDGTDSSIVDIEKIKMLLPKTTKIDDDYLKRLVFTAVNSINKAINKLKSNTNQYLQSSLLKKICTSVSLVDFELDEKIEDKSTHNLSNNNSIMDNVKKKEYLKKYLEGKKADDVAEFDFYSDLTYVCNLIGEHITDVLELHKRVKEKSKKSRKNTDLTDQHVENREKTSDEESSNLNKSVNLNLKSTEGLIHLERKTIKEEDEEENYLSK